MREDDAREVVETLRARVAELEAARDERQRTGADPEHGKRWFQTILDTIPHPIFSKDARLRYDACNAAFCAFLGLPADRIVGATVHDVSTPDKAAIYDRADRELLRSRGHQTYETLVRHADGTDHAVLFHKGVYLDPDGEVGGMVGIIVDISERKQIEAALLESQRRVCEREQRWLAMIENASDAVTLFSAEGTVLYHSPAITRMLGWLPEELLDRPALELCHPDDLAAAVPKLQALLAQPGATASATARMRHKDGSWRHIESVGQNLTHVLAVGAVVVNLRDVTEQRALEEQLRQAQKMESIGRLAGGIAHDFNNLLTGICGYTELMLQDLRPEDPLRASATEVLAAGERATGLVRQLLAFSRKQVLQPAVLDLSGLVRERANMLRRLIGEDVELHTALEARRRVKADPVQLEQVILNLVINARDAMPAGGKLMVETADITFDAAYAAQHAAVQPGDYVLLAISDTGHGMDAETCAHIFEPFFTTKEKGKGTGLGLSTVYGIVRQSGGWIRVHSEPGRGTTFRVYLPEEPTRAAPAEPVSPGPTPRGSETVLVVEDEAIVRGMVNAALSGKGYRVLDAADGAAARRLCEEHEGKIDLLLTDVVMPRVSGRELARQLVELRPGMRVIFMSGYAENAVAQHGVLEAGLELLAKPCSPDALARLVRAVLDSPSRGTKV